jgi:uncharacterized protein with HEPN domain
MNMSKEADRERSYLTDMLVYARKANSRVAGLTRAEFDQNETLQLAVTYLIQIVGEAASRLSEVTRATLPDLPWHDMIGMRHRLVHHYGTVSYDIVWDVAFNDLPALIAHLEAAVG